MLSTDGKQCLFPPPSLHCFKRSKITGNAIKRQIYMDSQAAMPCVTCDHTHKLVTTPTYLCFFYPFITLLTEKLF